VGAAGLGSPRIHVHVPYAKFKEFEPTLRANRLSIELYLGSQSIDGITERDLHTLKESMGWGHTISIHGPFMDLSPGAIDSKIAAASLERYLQVISFSEILRPEVVVFHSGYEKWKYAGETELWLSQSVKTWRAVMEKADKSGTRVAIENIVDTEPDNLRLLAERMDHPNFGLCLDVGHREIFSKLSITDWVDGMHPYIFEMHLHDNNGNADEHLPVGDGIVDFSSLFSRLKALEADPVMTLEAHSSEDALKSISRLKNFL